MPDTCQTELCRNGTRHRPGCVKRNSARWRNRAKMRCVRDMQTFQASDDDGVPRSSQTWAVARPVAASHRRGM